MKYGNLVCSNNVRCAFLAAVVRSFQKHHPGNYLGRTAMQKLVYFAKTLGAPIPCSFGIYTYGPYSDAVTFDMESLLADEVVEDRSDKPEQYSNYRIGPNAEELLAGFASQVEPHTEVIDRVVSTLGRYNPRELELIATLHFVVEGRRLTRRSQAKDDIIQEFRRIKGDKFLLNEISSWYDSLKAIAII
jgi:uncharacterized protein